MYGLLGQVGRMVEEVTFKVASSLADLVGTEVKLKVVPPTWSCKAMAGGHSGKWPCVAARLWVAGGTLEVFLLVPAALLERILADILPAEIGGAVMPGSFLESLSSLLIMEGLLSVGDAAPGVRLDAVSFLDDPSDLLLAGDFYFLDLQFSMGRASGILTLLFPAEKIKQMGKESRLMLAQSPAALPRRLLACKTNVSVICAAAVVTPRELARIEVGDVILPDWWAGKTAAPPLTLKLALSTGSRLTALGTCMPQGCGLKVLRTTLDNLETIMPELDGKPDEDKTEPYEGVSSLPRGVSEIPLEVAVEAARVSMTVGEIASLVEGSVIKLDRPVSAEVTLRGGGQILAYGVLVSVDGEMGVQVLKVVK